MSTRLQIQTALDATTHTELVYVCENALLFSGGPANVSACVCVPGL